MHVVELGPHDNMTPEQALAYSSRETWESVAIVGYLGSGEFEVVSANMTRERMLWMAEQLKMHAVSDD